HWNGSPGLASPGASPWPGSKANVSSTDRGMSSTRLTCFRSAESSNDRGDGDVLCNPAGLSEQPMLAVRTIASQTLDLGSPTFVTATPQARLTPGSGAAGARPTRRPNTSQPACR